MILLAAAETPARVSVCLFVFVCLLVSRVLRHNSLFVGMVRMTYVYIDTVFGFYGYLFFIPIFTA